MLTARDCIRYSGLNPQDMPAIKQTSASSRSAMALLAALGDRGTDPARLRNLLVYEIRATLDLGLHDHARQLFEALCMLLEEHPEARLHGVDVGSSREAVA